jgi:hypothetical protein
LRTVFVFNAAPADLYMLVNNGPNRFTVPMCGENWGPGVPAAADAPVFSGGTSGNNGEFKIGPNTVGLTPVKGGGTSNTTITIPDNVGPRSDLQLYVFYKDVNSVSWTLLEDGVPIGGSVAL